MRGRDPVRGMGVSKGSRCSKRSLVPHGPPWKELVLTTHDQLQKVISSPRHSHYSAG